MERAARRNRRRWGKVRGGSKDAESTAEVGTGPGVDGCASKAGHRSAPHDRSLVSANGTLTSLVYYCWRHDSHKDATVYYPSNGTGPYVVVVIVPGFTTPASLMAPWGRFMASHGYVGVTAGPPSESDSPEVRATALWAVISSMKTENTRAGGPLIGKVSECFAVMGAHGRRGSLSPPPRTDAIKAEIPLNPYQPSAVSQSWRTSSEGQKRHHAPAASPDARTTTAFRRRTSSSTRSVGGNHRRNFPHGLTARSPSVAQINVDGDARFAPCSTERQPAFDLETTGSSVRTARSSSSAPPGVSVDARRMADDMSIYRGSGIKSNHSLVALSVALAFSPPSRLGAARHVRSSRIETVDVGTVVRYRVHHDHENFLPAREDDERRSRSTSSIERAYA